MYVAELRAIGEYCGYGRQLTEMIRDRLVCGVNDRNIQRRLLQEPALTYKMAYNIAIAMESVSKNVYDLGKPTIPHVQHIQTSSRQQTNSSYNRSHNHSSYQPQSKQQTKIIRHSCGSPGHIATLCRFKETICHSCGKKGHLSKVCNSKKGKVKDQSNLHSLLSCSSPSPDIQPQPSDHHSIPSLTTSHSLL